MTYDFTKFKEEVEATKSWLASELSNLRTGQATPSILDGVQVESYEVMTPLSQVASITVEDARTIRVAPWNKGLIKDIEKAIVDKDLGVSVAVDDAGVRVIFPEVTGEGREKLVKIAKSKFEEARVRVRQSRDDIQGDIKKSDDMSEDEQKLALTEMQKITDEANKDLETAFNKKSEDILTV